MLYTRRSSDSESEHVLMPVRSHAGSESGSRRSPTVDHNYLGVPQARPRASNAGGGLQPTIVNIGSLPSARRRSNRSQSRSRSRSRSRSWPRYRDRTPSEREYIFIPRDRDGYDEDLYRGVDNYDDYDGRREHVYSESDDSASSFVAVRRRLTRAERYCKPDNVIEVDLQNIADGSTFDAKLPARQITEHRLDRLAQTRQRYHFESIEWRKILSVRRYVNQDARENALVQSQMSMAGGGKADFQFQWIHLKAKFRLLHDFQNFVAALDSVDPDERSLATILLTKAAKEHEQSHSWGKFLEGRVDRCDGHKGSEPDKWAIFLSIHHLHAAPRPRDQSIAADSHHPRTLFEYHYKDQENTQERDAKQIMRQASQSDEILHVHNMWVLLLSSGSALFLSLWCFVVTLFVGTLITSSPDAMGDCLGPSVLVEDITTQSEKGELQIIRFLDPTDRQFFVPSAQCETWFAMMGKVVGLCGSIYGDALERYHINDVNGVEVTAPEWQQFLASQNSFCATVRISLTSNTPPALEGPEAFRRDSITNSIRIDHRALVRIHRDDESPNYRISRRRRRRDRSRRHRDEVKARIEEEARIEKKTNEIEREVASVLQPRHGPAPNLGANVTDGTSPTSRTTTIKHEYQGMYSHDRTESPAPLDTTAQESRAQRSRSPPARRGPRRTADSSAPVARRTRTSTYVEVPGLRRDENTLALVPYREARGRSREPGTVSRKSTGAADYRITPKKPSADADRDGDMLALVRRDMRSIDEREKSIKRRRENPTYRVDFLPNIITNESLNVRKFDHIFYLPEEIFHSIKGPTVENQGLNTVPGGQGARKTTSPSEQGQDSSFQTRVVEHVHADITKPPEPLWKTRRDKRTPAENPPPPVFLWQTGHIKPQTSDEVDPSSKETQGTPAVPPAAEEGCVTAFSSRNNTVNDLQDLQVLNLILSQIHLTLSRGDRISGDAVQRLKDTEAPIYKLLQESSIDVVQAAFAQICGRDNAPKAEQDPASSDVTAKIGLCLEILKDLMDFFLPQDYPSIVLKKFWGGVAIWLKKLEQMLSAESSQGSRYARQGRSELPLDAFYVVNAELAPRNSQDPSLKLPHPLLEECPSCIHWLSHPDMDTAIFHLRHVHFRNAEVTREELQEWVRKGDRVDSFRLRCDAKRLVDTVLDHCTNLRVLKNEVVAGVCGSGKFDSAVYKLPNGLVRAFERILMMMAYSGYAASLTLQAYRESPERFRRFFESTHQNHIIELGYAAEGAFDEAKSNLMLMSRVNEYSNSIQYDTVGPEYMVLLLLAGLRDRGSKRNPLNLPKLHRKELSRLTFEAHNHPRRRLLQEIRMLETEVSAVLDIRRDCSKVLHDYRDMLASSGFKKTTTTRRRLYHDFEENLADKLFKEDRQDIREADELLGEIPQLCSQLTQAVEIQQEDHGKAILVFTIVTIVFLPMSFVTGFMGMNTADIRNQESGQWVFWAAAIPLTFVVVALTVWIGYNSESLSQWLWMWQTNRKQRQFKSSWEESRAEKRHAFRKQGGNEKVSETTNTAPATAATATTTRPLPGLRGWKSARQTRKSRSVKRNAYFYV
ncbi:uncharacterized protein Z518_08846 [Rhinocladiella mackenziei CBS 650.93]|uniref:Uncharacterized protein n=1 Tax=Rhinocladiella mackenziei CBS 650.93 TaxID=1442369 RepID=A0A0D2GXK2_9EURO|nr:uncharacterized protein Z518_08846 [Rhinocladiella mackenziei CBS 650.93]KIX02903.1 hypothetical protein Z518_08846 [Rhinocladiella mackenziei CBS 650.93]